MFNCGFYSSSHTILISVLQTHTHAKCYQNPLKNDVASLTSSLSASTAIVLNASILTLLKIAFICQCENYLTIKFNAGNLSFVYTRLQRLTFIKRR